jgi:hypothetical protein
MVMAFHKRNGISVGADVSALPWAFLYPAHFVKKHNLRFSQDALCRKG